MKRLWLNWENHENDFFKDLEKLPSENVLIEVRKTIINVEKAIQISQISDLKKLKSFKNAYRIIRIEPISYLSIGSEIKPSR